MSKTALAILGFLADQPMHGYEIIQTINKRHMDMWLHISPASVYNTLIRLDKKEFIKESKVKIGRTPERNVYSLTGNGKKHLKKLVEKQLEKYCVSEYPYGLAIAFINHSDPATSHKLLSNRLSILRKIHRGMREERDMLAEKLPVNWMALLRNGLDHVQAEINQIEYLMKNLKFKTSNNKSKTNH